MNGIISDSASRFRRNKVVRRQFAAVLAGGICLCSGFVFGMKVTPDTKLFHFLATKTLDYSQITWIKDSVSNQPTFQANGSLGALDDVKIEFQAFVLPETKPVHLLAQHSFEKKKVSSLSALKSVYQKTLQMLAKREPKAPRKISRFRDFRVAAEALQAKFLYAVTSSSKMKVELAKADLLFDTLFPKKPLLQSLIVNTRSEATVKITQASAELVSDSVAVQEKVKPIKLVKHPKRTNAVKLIVADQKADDENIQVTEISYPHSDKMNNQLVNTQVKTPETHVYMSRAEQKPMLAGTENGPKEVHFSADLSKAEKKKLENLLLNEELKTANAQQTALNNVVINNKIQAHAQASVPVKIVPNLYHSDPPDTDDETEKDKRKVPDPSPNFTSSTCNILGSHVFMKPQGSETGKVDNQVCPEHKEWLSIDSSNRGWVKVSGTDVLNTLTRHPAANGEPTLLLDQNAIAFVAIKSGVHVAKGAGIISGVVPPGYKIEFTGRAEDAQYFDLAGKKYFIILNAEPGAGVLELESEKNQNLSTTVFTPVLEDTVTYLDLSEPKRVNIGVQIEKNSPTQASELTGLSVGVSAQKNLQAITRSNGQAVLKNVNVVKGFPLFIDVSSKFKDQPSYTYRYELNTSHIKADQFKNFIVKQENELSIAKWLKQVHQGLSDQSAMVLGLYDRKKLNGFKSYYYAQTQSKTAKFGLEPKSFSILVDDKISTEEPLEGDIPRFMSVQVPEGLSQVQLLNEKRQIVEAQLIPVSPRVIHVISE